MCRDVKFRWDRSTTFTDSKKEFVAYSPTVLVNLKVGHVFERGVAVLAFDDPLVHVKALLVKTSADDRSETSVAFRAFQMILSPVKLHVLRQVGAAEESLTEGANCFGDKTYCIKNRSPDSYSFQSHR